MTQITLFDRINPEPAWPQPTTPRASRQCQAILDRLRVGKVSNRELAGLCLKYTSRISDLRQQGYDVRCVEHDRATGLAWYQLG